MTVRIIRVLRIIISLLILSTSFLYAHSDTQHDGQGGATLTDERRADPAMAVIEHLGSKLPLDTMFRDEAGGGVRLRDLVTGPTIIIPVYYACSNVCNFVQGGLARVLPSVSRVPAEEYRIISVSFDENENHVHAQRSRKIVFDSIRSQFPEKGWRFLTGDLASIKELTAAAGFSFRRKGVDFIHPVVSIVITGDGTIVRYLYGTSFLAKDVTLALVEARDGKVGQTIRKMVDFCFSYDPAGKTYVFNLLRVSASVVILSAAALMLFLLLARKKRRKRAEEP